MLGDYRSLLCYKYKGGLEGNGVDLSVACVVQICSLRVERDVCMRLFKFSVLCEICLIKYAYLECVFRIVDNIVRGLQLQVKSCVVDSCFILLRISMEFSTVKVGYMYLISLY
jgi:hypothetical protein